MKMISDDDDSGDDDGECCIFRKYSQNCLKRSFLVLLGPRVQIKLQDYEERVYPDAYV